MITVPWGATVAFNGGLQSENPKILAAVKTTEDA